MISKSLLLILFSQLQQMQQQTIKMQKQINLKSYHQIQKTVKKLQRIAYTPGHPIVIIDEIHRLADKLNLELKELRGY